MNKNLFKQWRRRKIHKGKPFISDGAIDPKKWRRSDNRILFLAKESHGDEYDLESWDLCELVREEWKESKYKFWWTLGYWAFGIRNTTSSSIPDFPGYREQWAEVSNAVLESAIVNIKKSGGKSSSDDDDLQKYIKSDRDLIKQQIDQLDPKVVVCCYVWDLVKHLWNNPDEESQYIYYAEDRVFINYWHPANHYPNEVMFYALCAVYQKSLQAKTKKRT